MSLRRWIGGISSATTASSTGEPSRDEWWTESGERYFGMENFGNTCYVNSVLQALYFCKPFRELLQVSGDHLPKSQHHTAPNTLSSTFINPAWIDPSQPGHLNAKSAYNQHVPSSSTTMSKSSSRVGTVGLSAGKSGLANAFSGGGRKSIASQSKKSATGFTNGNTDGATTTATQTNGYGSGSVPPQASSSSALSSNQSPLTTQPNSTPHKRNWSAADPDQPGYGAHTRNNPSSTSDDAPASSTQTAPRPIAAGSEPPFLTTLVPSTIHSTLRDLFHSITSQPKAMGAIAPGAFITTLKRENELFRGSMHQDAHEFLNYLLNTVAEDVVSWEKTQPNNTSTNTSNRTWVHELFEGILTNETKCLTCETITQRDESFLDLSIDIEQNTSVTACLRQFSASEIMCQKNKFSCDRCCGLQEAERRMKIKKLPNILALHLKRFKYQETLQRYTKLAYCVVFPLELKLFNTTDDIPDSDRLYELWAIVVHIGAGPHHGHYVTILKSAGRWILFDDNTVTPIDETEISKYYGDTPGVGSGYVLFYQTVDLEIGINEHERNDDDGDDDGDDEDAGFEDSRSKKRREEFVVPVDLQETAHTLQREAERMRGEEVSNSGGDASRATTSVGTSSSRQSGPRLETNDAPTKSSGADEESSREVLPGGPTKGSHAMPDLASQPTSPARVLPTPSSSPMKPVRKRSLGLGIFGGGNSPSTSLGGLNGIEGESKPSASRKSSLVGADSSPTHQSSRSNLRASALSMTQSSTLPPPVPPLPETHSPTLSLHGFKNSPASTQTSTTTSPSTPIARTMNNTTTVSTSNDVGPGNTMTESSHSRRNSTTCTSDFSNSIPSTISLSTQPESTITPTKLNTTTTTSGGGGGGGGLFSKRSLRVSTSNRLSSGIFGSPKPSKSVDQSIPPVPQHHSRQDTSVSSSGGGEVGTSSFVSSMTTNPADSFTTTSTTLSIPQPNHSLSPKQQKEVQKAKDRATKLAEKQSVKLEKMKEKEVKQKEKVEMKTKLKLKKIS